MHTVLHEKPLKETDNSIPIINVFQCDTDDSITISKSANVSPNNNPSLQPIRRMAMNQLRHSKVTKSTPFSKQSKVILNKSKVLPPIAKSKCSSGTKSFLVPSNKLIQKSVSKSSLTSSSKKSQRIIIDVLNIPNQIVHPRRNSYKELSKPLSKVIKNRSGKNKRLILN